MTETQNNSNQYGVTTDEIMDYLKDNMVTREEVHGLKEEVHGLKEEVHGLKEEVQSLKEDVGRVKFEIIDHVDDKLADLKGDLVVLMRKEDRKLASLVELLVDRKVITITDAKTIFQMEPFSRPAV